MKARIIAFTIQRMLREASLIDLRDARRIADLCKDSALSGLIKAEMDRRLL
jgi:hypothetical protein